MFASNVTSLGKKSLWQSLFHQSFGKHFIFIKVWFSAMYFVDCEIGRDMSLLIGNVEKLCKIPMPHMHSHYQSMRWWDRKLVEKKNGGKCDVVMSPVLASSLLEREGQCCNFMCLHTENHTQVLNENYTRMLMFTSSQKMKNKNLKLSLNRSFDVDPIFHKTRKIVKKKEFLFRYCQYFYISLINKNVKRRER